ncbi:MAG: NYN domain-containing protein [Berryella intestinalis]|uniref:NYN domain-containing protein n=1 Tax=Berryella intestinalis TaxID=1531429 RepID=UPI002A597D45|nr:NYN domain-containing protein [Berryella intestinalis]MDD7369352.1 NYN domain-containing protein [Berryella intestinalis]MDY3129165.1 NYN domain-containing protein [Berryella intestinalis]
MPRDRKRILVVDGYNVLRSGSRYRLVPDPDYTDDAFNRAREALISDVVHFAGREWRATVVFDGGGNRFSKGDPDFVGGVRVVFSPAGSSADRIIEKIAREGRENGFEVMVVTSDATIQDTVFGLGVDRMSAEGFCRDVGRYFEEARLDEAPRIAKKNTVAGRIDAATLAKLKALRDGR